MASPCAESCSLRGGGGRPHRIDLPRSAQPPRLEPEDLTSSVADIPEPTLPTPPAPRRAIHWSDPFSELYYNSSYNGQ
jgi:hypothetical protein